MFKQKRNILMIMFALIVVMGIGFTAYSQQLQIKDTSSIDSDWNVYIKNVSVESKSDSATGSGSVDETTRLKADLTTDLKYPGDNVIYKLIVANDGTIDAILEKINFNMEKEDTVINYYYSVDDKETWNKVTKEGNNPYNEDLLAKTTDDFYVKVEYDPTKTGTATDNQKSNKLTLDFHYAQKTGGGAVVTPTTPKIVYSEKTLLEPDYVSSTVIKIGDSLDKIKGYTEDYNTLNSKSFLKHIMSDGVVESSELCFIKDGIHCIKPNEYEVSKTSLISIFGEESCYGIDDGTYYRCSGSPFFAGTDKAGQVFINDGRDECTVYSDGSAMCGNL